MQRAELAAGLVTADSAQREALLRENSALADAQLARILKDICLDGWSTHPAQALGAAAALRLVAGVSHDPEIDALECWTAGLEALISGEMERAVTSLDDAARRFRTINLRLDAAATQISKLVALAMLGLYEQAIACGLQAREEFLTHEDLLNAGKIEHNIGNIYFRRDLYAEAEKFQRAAHERFLRINDATQLTKIENSLALTLAQQHRLREAEQLYEQALGRAAMTHQVSTQAAIESSIGMLALYQGRYDRALDFLERSRRKYVELGLAYLSASTEQELADAYLELNLMPEAAAIYERVTQTFAALGMRAEEARACAYHARAEVALGHVQKAHALLQQGATLYAAENNEVGTAVIKLTEAQLFYSRRECHAARKSAAAAEPALTRAAASRHLAFARWLHAEAARCEGLTEEARRILDEILSQPETQPDIAARCYSSFGLLAKRAGDRTAAEESFRHSIAITEKLRAPLPAEEFRASFFADKLTPYNELARLCLDDGRTAEAFMFVERARSRALADSLGGDFVLQIEGRDQFEADLLCRIEQLRGELNYFYRQLHLLRSAAAANQDLTGLQDEIRERERGILAITRQLQHRDQAITRAVDSLDVPSFQKRLGPDKAFIEYTTIDDQLIAFVITDQEIKVATNLGAEVAVNSEIGQLRFQIDTLRYGSRGVHKHVDMLVRRTRKHLETLHATLVRPLAAMIGSRRHLIIAPHRALHYLPFQALHDGSSYLIEQREVSYAPSALVLQQCLDQTRRDLQQAVILGRADELIPRVADEVEAIRQVFPQAISRVDDEVTIEAVNELAARADVLHFACHAQFRADNPLFSSLELANGWFTVRDAYRLKLKCELVTLSACETGVNAVMPGDELIGLARGFFAGGAPSVLLSLWTVDDEATGRLMVKFYRGLRATGSAAQALREAQIEALHEKPHPFFWAPFVLVGRG